MNNYVAFYMDGRSDIADDAGTIEVDLTALAKRVLDGEDMYAVTKEVAAAALAPRANSTSKARWMKECAAAITEAGGDKETAYARFLAGQIDEVRLMLEEQVCEEIDTELDEGDVEDDEEEEDEDEEDDEDEDEEDEDVAKP